MDSNQAQPVRPRTMWLGPKRKRDLDLEIEQASRSQLFPLDSQAETSTTASTVTRPAPTRQKNQSVIPRIWQVEEDPWLTYEPIVQLFGRPVFLARLRSSKAELLHIQKLERQSPSAQSLVDSRRVGVVCLSKDGWVRNLLVLALLSRRVLRSSFVFLAEPLSKGVAPEASPALWCAFLRAGWVIEN